MVAIPAAKLFFLAVRQFSKPVANAIKKYAVNHPGFKRAVVGFAQKWHVMDMGIKTKIMGHEKMAVKPLSESKAIESASDVVSELVIYGIASSALVLEYMRSSEKDRLKEQHLHETFDDMASRVEVLEQLVNDLRNKTSPSIHHTIAEQKERPPYIVEPINRLASYNPNTLYSSIVSFFYPNPEKDVVDE